MLTTTTNYEKITAKIIKAIERGQAPPWRRENSDIENDGFPTRPATLKPFAGVDVLLLNMAATEKKLNSKFWGTEQEWAYLGSQVSGQATILADETPVFNADQTVLNQSSFPYRSRKRRTPVVVDYSPAEAVIKASGATIHHRLGMEAAYYFPPADYIIFPLLCQFILGPGGKVAYYDSLFHELSHFSEPRLSWDGPPEIRELRSEIAAPFLASRLGIPVLCDVKKLTNHGNFLARWVTAMKSDPTLIFTVTADASQAVDYLLSLRGS